MKHLTISQLKEMLLKQKGAAPITIESLTDTRARKTNNPYEKILKLSTVNGFTGTDYEASVNRQQVREGSDPSFTAQERSWGTKVSNVLVEKDDKWYISIRPLKSLTEPLYYGVNGGVLKAVAKSEIEKFLPPVYVAQNQGTETEIPFRNYSLENLRKITIGGQTYEIVK